MSEWAAPDLTYSKRSVLRVPGAVPERNLSFMSCLVCTELMRVLKSADEEYGTARAAPFYLVSTEIAARMQVDMERARIALSEHISSCPSSTVSDTTLSLVVPRG